MSGVPESGRGSEADGSGRPECRVRLSIASTWDGTPIDRSEIATVSFEMHDTEGVIEVEAPFHGDPSPAGPDGRHAPPGRYEGLWEYEVVELFLVGDRGAYLELEFGPRGHWLALLFSQPRDCVRRDLAVAVDEIAIDPHAGPHRDRRWRGRFRIAHGDTMREIVAANAFAIHGIGAGRRYLAAHPLPGDVPDFHQPGRYPALEIRGARR